MLRGKRTFVMKLSMVEPGMVFVSVGAYGTKGVWMAVGCTREAGDITIDFIICDSINETSRLQRLRGLRKSVLHGLELVWSP